MNKAELIKVLSAKANGSQTQAKAFVEAFTDTVTEVLKKDDKLTLVGFGTFDVQHIAGRTGRNPRTGAPLQIKPKKKPRFKAGAELSGHIN